MARTAASVKKRRYKLYYRAAASFGAGNYDTLANYTTFLATFTDAGYCRAGLGFAIEKGDVEECDDGTELVMGFNGTFEAEFLQTTVADYSALDALEGVSTDFLLVPTGTETLHAICIPATTPYMGEEVKAGNTEVIKIMYDKKNLAEKADFRTRFTIPTT